MKVVFVSNILNHHSEPLCEEFIKSGNQIYFIATSSSQGYGYQKEIIKDYVIKPLDIENKKLAISHIKDADIAIFGAGSDEYIRYRMIEDKLSYLYSERFFKKGVWRALIPSTRKKLYNRIGKYKNNKMYVLCASAYLPYDLSIINYPFNKCFKWGYFPRLNNTENMEDLVSKKNTNEVVILWVGRLIKLKHPEVMTKLAYKLKKMDINLL
ncbi:MAG: hypothetical protein R3Y45_06715 [Bacillota bacterium]